MGGRPGARCHKHLLLGDATASPQLHVEGNFFSLLLFSFFLPWPNPSCSLLSFCTRKGQARTCCTLTRQSAAPVPTPTSLQVHMSHQTMQQKKEEKSKSISFLYSKVNKSPPRAFLDVCGASCVYATRAAAPAAKRRDSPRSRSALSQQSRRRCPADLSRVCGEESRRGGEIQYTSAAGSGLYLGKSNGTVCYQKKQQQWKEKPFGCTGWSASGSQSSDSNFYM